MAAGNKLLLALASFLLCYATTSMAAEFIINSTDGMIYMDSFVAHEDFYSSLQELIRHKVRSAIDDLVARSKVDVTQLVPNMDVAEYTIFQMLHSLVHDDLSYFYQLVESLRYWPAEEHFDFRSRAGAFSKSMRSNISYSPSEMYKVAKSLINVEQSRFKTIDKLIVKGIFLIMNKSEIFKESSRRGDIEVMKWILSSENCLDLSSALDTACRQKRFDIVRLLIENDKSNQLRIIDMTNCSKETLLQIAVQTKSRHFVSLLIRSGVSVNVQDPNGLSPLYLAVKNENLDMSRLLIENGADVNLEAVDGSTALHEAVRSGMADMAELLIGSGSIPQCKDRYGINPMMMLEKYVITNIARYLLYNQVNIPEDDLRCSLYFMLPDGGGEGGSNPHRQIVEPKNILRNAQLYDRMKSRVLRSPCKEEGIRAKLLNITMINLITPFVQSLVNLGVPLDVGSKDTEEVFLNAIEKGNIEMTTFLINKGVSVNMTKDGLSTLHVALINRHKKIFYLLVDRGADILAVTSRGRSLLHSACEGQQKAEVEYLIKRGLNVNATDSSSVTPLQVAASTGNYDVITTLVKYGANVRFRSTTTPLIAASISGNVKAVNFLLDNGADIEEKANFKMTPLIAAVNTGNEDMVEALLNRGASVHAKEDSRGDTALHIAAKKGYLKIVEMLLKRGHNKEVRNSDGRTALDLAVARRDSSIISALAKA